MCTRCGAKSIGVRCEKCKEERKRVCAEKVANGICTVDNCSREAAPGRRMCQHHADYHRNRRRSKQGHTRSWGNYRGRNIIDMLNDYDAIL